LEQYIGPVRDNIVGEAVEVKDVVDKVVCQVKAVSELWVATKCACMLAFIWLMKMA
jgi:hypothetical protein